MRSHLIDVDGARLHVGESGSGPDVVVLSGGPGCVHYLERDSLVVPGHRCWFPWSAAYEAGKAGEPVVPIDWSAEVWTSLSDSFTEWIHAPDVWRTLADCPVPMRFIAAERDIRPDWPMRQLAATVPHGSFSVVPDVPHDFWATDPDVWVATVNRELGAGST